MHILYLHQYFCPPGGSGNNRSFQLAKHWTDAGHKVTFITSPAYFPGEYRQEMGDMSVRKENYGGVEVHVLNVPYTHMMLFKERIKAFMRFYRKAKRYAHNLEAPDIIYASSTPLTIGQLGMKLGFKWRIPFIFEAVDVWPDVPVGMGILKNKVIIRKLYRQTDKIYRNAAHIVALSDGMKEQICSHDVPDGKVMVAYNGTDPELIPFKERDHAQRQVRVVYAGTVGIANGLAQMVELARRIGNIGRSDISFTILGDGNDLANVKAAAEAAGTDNLTFLGKVPKEEVPEILNGAHIGLVCFANHKVLEANSANKFYDYLASGLPVLINYRGWQARYLKEYECGLSSDQGDLDAWAKNLIKLADSPELRTQMARNGRKLAEQLFDRKQIAEDILQLMEKTKREV